ncbi:nucleotidyltransferase domain-containing protein [Priestia endophytica]|jgi:Aminoglycoside-2''-adenylyltransferase|uniref:nucleotidyltransferase domain-containing protein n=1 Tax=Priestia endophytica TaxID=135735 RepID=UPI000F5307B3|nr:hypothetical protein [Priestia endophytica]RPK04770.1 hypothetical protein FH5_02008 [Priestia endophytica]
MVAIKSDQLDFVINVMKDFKYPWFFAGGWSIDLGIGNITRDHEDIDICIFREHALEVLSYFSEWTIYVAIPGEGRLELCQTLKDLDPPRYGLHLHRDQDFIEILLTDRSGEDVLFRKNHRISMNYKQFVQEDSLGRKYVAPEWQLLFKAKEGRLKDEEDFKACLPFMRNEQRLWLSSALQKQYPSCSWIKQLTT